MLKYFVLILVVIILLALLLTKNKRVFNEDIYRIYRDLKKELGFSGIQGDPFDNAKNFLRSQGLQQSDLAKLQTLITINTSNYNLITQIGTITATVILTISTLAFGTIFSAVLSGLYSQYAEMSLGSGDSKKIEQLFYAMDSVVNYTGTEFLIIVWLLLGGISIWKLCSTDTNQTNMIMLRIVSDEIRDKNRLRLHYRAPK
ncbi:hypothetical protein P4V54_20220 [Brevibacillus nitrificans]|uniref:hypothetical protein n=1 Tax=Brevibacillus nitrificans TaxID=651560 RepID=UPI002E1D2152|nr:hypothetical protein [Brevibacillus nitrificans]